MCSVRGQSHGLPLSLHYVRRLQGNAARSSSSHLRFRLPGFFFFSWALRPSARRGSSGEPSRRTWTPPTLVSTRGNASSTEWHETSARNVDSRSALRWEWRPTVSGCVFSRLSLRTHNFFSWQWSHNPNFFHTSQIYSKEIKMLRPVSIRMSSKQNKKK